MKKPPLGGGGTRDKGPVTRKGNGMCAFLFIWSRVTDTSAPSLSVDTTSPVIWAPLVPAMRDVPDPSIPADAAEILCPLCNVVCSAWAEPDTVGMGAPAESIIGTAPLTVQFHSEATPAGCADPVSHHWDFGNGDTSAEQNPQYTYVIPGTYDWSYTASADDATCPVTDTIEVLPPPGDCDGNGTVTIGEVQRAINMFLGIEPPACGVDCDGNGTVSIGEVQKVINGFLGLPGSC